MVQKRQMSCVIWAILTNTNRKQHYTKHNNTLLVQNNVKQETGNGLMGHMFFFLITFLKTFFKWQCKSFAFCRHTSLLLFCICLLQFSIRTYSAFELTPPRMYPIMLPISYFTSLRSASASNTSLQRETQQQEWFQKQAETGGSREVHILVAWHKKVKKTKHKRSINSIFFHAKEAVFSVDHMQHVAGDCGSMKDDALKSSSFDFHLQTESCRFIFSPKYYTLRRDGRVECWVGEKLFKIII